MLQGATSTGSELSEDGVEEGQNPIKTEDDGNVLSEVDTTKVCRSHARETPLTDPLRLRRRLRGLPVDLASARFPSGVET